MQMLKHSFVIGILLGVISCANTDRTTSVISQIEKNEPTNFLGETRYINYSHPSIQQVVTTLTLNTHSDVEKAVALHNFVRDEIKFGFEAGFYEMTASEVLSVKRGYCNTKSTLFIAMLRAAGIPARHRFYALSSDVLTGILNPGTAYVDHSIVEVYLNDEWVGTDSYIVDHSLFVGASKRSKQFLGYGIRRDGQINWDGIESSFSQYHPDYVSTDFGVYDDVEDFYQNAQGTHNKLNLFVRLISNVAFDRANLNLNSIRKE